MIEVTEGILTAGIVTGGTLLVAVCTLIGVIVKQRGDRAAAKDATVATGTQTLLSGLHDEMRRLTEKHDQLEVEFKSLRGSFDELKQLLGQKMRAVGRILLHLDRLMESPPDLTPIQTDLDMLREDGVVPFRWDLANRITPPTPPRE